MAVKEKIRIRIKGLLHRTLCIQIRGLIYLLEFKLMALRRRSRTLPLLKKNKRKTPCLIQKLS